MHANVDAGPMHSPSVHALDDHIINISPSALDLNHFSCNKTYACIDLIHAQQKTKTKNQNCLFIFVKNYKWLKNATKYEECFHSEKNGSVDVTITRAIIQQKHLTQYTKCILHFQYNPHIY